jgi:hypothetical protein
MLDRCHVRGLVDEIFGDDLHEKRLLTLSNSVVGVLHAASLAIHAIVAQRHVKHGLKQIDR